MNSEEINYNAFVDHNDVKPKNENIRLDQSKSMFSKKQEKPSQEDFKKSVSEQVANQNEIFKEVQASSKQYWGLVRSKILPDAKEQAHIDLENRTVSTLVNIANKINNDETQPEGFGSVGLCQLLLQVCLFQRDAINSLNYRLQQLENSTEQLKK